MPKATNIFYMNAVRLCILFVVVVGCSKTAQAQSLSLEALVVETKRALLRVEQEWEPPKLKLKSVTLTLSTGMSVAANGKVSFWVFDMGGDAKTSGASRINLILTPPDAESGSDVASAGLSDSLAELILSSASAIEEAMKGKPELNIQEYEAALVFGIVKSGSGGISIALPPFSGRIGGEYSTSSEQKISVKFGITD